MQKGRAKSIDKDSLLKQLVNWIFAPRRPLLAQQVLDELERCRHRFFYIETRPSATLRPKLFPNRSRPEREGAGAEIFEEGKVARTPRNKTPSNPLKTNDEAKSPDF